MTEDQIAEIQAASKRRYQELPARHKAELEAAVAEMSRLDATCDHKFPDGKNAMTSTMFRTSCEICGANGP